MRKNATIIIVGQKGTGKTTLSKKLLEQSKVPKKLVFDPTGQEAWQSYPRINPAHLPYWKKGAKRLFEEDTEEMLRLINQHVRDTFIVFDDASAYIDFIVKTEIKSLLTRNRHHNNDLIYIFHSLRLVPVRLYEYASHLILFKTNDSEKHLRKLDKVPQIEEIIKAYELVQRESEKNPHYCIGIEF